MSVRKETRQKHKRWKRRQLHVRRTIYGAAERPRLCVNRSRSNISCQAIDDSKGVTLAAVSTLQGDLRGQGPGGNCKAAAAVGTKIAEKLKELGLSSAQFDRRGYRYHGRIKALVEAVRAAGVKV